MNKILTAAFILLVSAGTAFAEVSAPSVTPTTPASPPVTQTCPFGTIPPAEFTRVVTADKIVVTGILKTTDDLGVNAITGLKIVIDAKNLDSSGVTPESIAGVMVIKTTSGQVFEVPFDKAGCVSANGWPVLKTAIDAKN